MIPSSISEKASDTISPTTPQPLHNKFCPNAEGMLWLVLIAAVAFPQTMG